MGRPKGIKFTEEQKEKLRGRIPWNKNLTKETSVKLQQIGNNISKSLKGKPTWNKNICGENYLKHLPNGKAWNNGLTKESHSGLKKISEQKMAENNPQWKGDEVGYTSLHEWVKNRKLKPLLCECCNKNKSYDLANISQEYKRDLSDWEWLCRRCHMRKDGRINNLKQYTKEVIICH